MLVKEAKTFGKISTGNSTIVGTTFGENQAVCRSRMES